MGIYLVLFFYSEYRIKDRSHFVNAFSICDSLKVEKFKVSSLTDLYADYLTDSTNFRIFIGTYHYYEDILYECHGDTIYMKKFNMDESKPKLIECNIYRLMTLKRKANYK